MENSHSEREMQAPRHRDTQTRKETQRDWERVGPAGSQGPMGAVTGRGSGPRLRWSLGGAQASPVPGVLKPVTVAIAQPHKLVKDYGAEEGSGVSMALQEPPREQLQPGQVLVVQGSCGFQHLGVRSVCTHVCISVYLCAGDGSYCCPTPQTQVPINCLAFCSGLRKSPLPTSPLSWWQIWWEDQCVPTHSETTVRCLRTISYDHRYPDCLDPMITSFRVTLPLGEERCRNRTMAPNPRTILHKWYNIVVRTIFWNQVAEFKFCLYD